MRKSKKFSKKCTAEDVAFALSRAIECPELFGTINNIAGEEEI